MRELMLYIIRYRYYMALLYGVVKTNRPYAKTKPLEFAKQNFVRPSQPKKKTSLVNG